MKSDDLEIRPIHHRLEEHVRAHVFLCMLAYYLEWHLRKAWAPLLFADENPQIPDDPVTQATRSPQAVRKARSRQTQFGDPAHSFRTLMDHLARQMRATMTIAGSGSCYRIATDSDPSPCLGVRVAKLKALLREQHAALQEQYAQLLTQSSTWGYSRLGGHDQHTRGSGESSREHSRRDREHMG